MTLKEATEKIRARELAIENDDIVALDKCCKHFWPTDILPSCQPINISLFVFQDNARDWAWTHNPTIDGYIKYNSAIPATELLKILVVEWTPEVGKEYEFGNNDIYFSKGKLLAIVDHKYKYIIDLLDDGVPAAGMNCRPIQKKQITIAELFKKAGLNQSEWEVVG